MACHGSYFQLSEILTPGERIIKNCFRLEIAETAHLVVSVRPAVCPTLNLPTGICYFENSRLGNHN